MKRFEEYLEATQNSKQQKNNYIAKKNFIIFHEKDDDGKTHTSFKEGDDLNFEVIKELKVYQVEFPDGTVAFVPVENVVKE